MPPINDNLVDAVAISGASGTDGPYTIDFATVEPGEVVGSFLTNGIHRSIWWAWTCPADGVYEFDTFASVISDGDTTLAAWSGTNFGNFVEEASNDDAGTGFLSKIHFTAVAGTTYYIQAGTFSSGATGSITINWAVFVPPTASYMVFGTTVQTQVAEYSEFQFSTNVIARDTDDNPVPDIPITLNITTTAPGVTFPPYTLITDSFGQVAFDIPQFPRVFDGFDDTSGPFDWASQLIFSSPGIPDLTWDFDVIGVTTLWSHTGSGTDKVQVYHQGTWKGISNTQIHEGGNWYNPCASGASKTAWIFLNGTWQKACGTSALIHAVNVNKWKCDYYENGVLVRSTMVYWPSFIPPETYFNSDLYTRPLSPADIPVTQTWGYTITGYKPGTQNGAYYSPQVIEDGVASSFASERDYTVGAWNFSGLSEIHSDSIFGFTSDSSLYMYRTATSLNVKFDFKWATATEVNAIMFTLEAGFNTIGTAPNYHKYFTLQCLPGSTFGTASSTGGSVSGVDPFDANFGGYDHGTFIGIVNTDGPALGNVHANGETVSVEMNIEYLGQRIRPWDKLSPTLDTDIEW